MHLIAAAEITPSGVPPTPHSRSTVERSETASSAAETSPSEISRTRAPASRISLSLSSWRGRSSMMTITSPMSRALALGDQLQRLGSGRSRSSRSANCCPAASFSMYTHGPGSNIVPRSASAITASARGMPLRGQRRALERVDGDVDLRRRAVADVLAVVEHRRLVLLALADDDEAVHVHACRARRAWRRRRPGRRRSCRRGRSSRAAASAAASVTRTSSRARLRSGRCVIARTGSKWSRAACGVDLGLAVAHDRAGEHRAPAPSSATNQPNCSSDEAARVARLAIRPTRSRAGRTRRSPTTEVISPRGHDSAWSRGDDPGEDQRRERAGEQEPAHDRVRASQPLTSPGAGRDRVQRVERRCQPAGEQRPRSRRAGDAVDRPPRRSTRLLSPVEGHRRGAYTVPACPTSAGV